MNSMQSTYHNPVTGSSNQNPLLRVADVAKRLNISRSLAYKLLQTGAIPTIRINTVVRVREDDLEEFIQKSITGQFRD